MPAKLQILDVVALAVDLPERGLRRGQVGTAVERLAEDVFEVEFADQQGLPYAFAALSEHELIPLLYEPARATG